MAPCTPRKPQPLPPSTDQDETPSPRRLQEQPSEWQHLGAAQWSSKAAKLSQRAEEMLMGQRRGCDEQESLAGAASPGCGPLLMDGTGDTEPALPCTSCHVHRLSRAQNDPKHSADGEPQPATAVQGKARPGRPLRWPQLQDVLREGLGRSKRCQTQESWSNAGASSEDVSPARVTATGTQPQATARTGRKETAWLFGSNVAGK